MFCRFALKKKKKKKKDPLFRVTPIGLVRVAHSPCYYIMSKICIVLLLGETAQAPGCIALAQQASM